ncbi:MAG: hypothetical protein QOE70_4058 [Chthoniobacter sp.]|nr:hypothetical protein [Chthoniobacter sp.]
MPRNKSKDPAKKRSISMPTSLYKKMLARMEKYGFISESAYLQFLTRNDIVKDGQMEVVPEPRSKGRPSPPRKTR